ncbi:hypothetical protein [Parasynechococcus sp.]|jgi:hypothetical protein|uniref:hypothetical protein n=1 Tax=Parasynechococcus sp. TaxID=3101203 RepID=UPI003703FB54
MDSRDQGEPRQLHPLPKGLVEVYGLIAVLVVLIPEWIADGTLNLGGRVVRNPLPMSGPAWKAIPELQLAALSLAELRILASRMRLIGYASDSRDKLTRRLLRRMRRRLRHRWNAL